MGTIEVIQKFIKSNSVVDRISKEIFERLPLRTRNRLYYGKTFLYWSAFLRESEYWDKERLEEFQFEQLKRLLRHASQKVPYYRELFADYGFDPEKMQDKDDLRVLPYLAKETVRDRLDDFIATDVSTDRLFKTTTSGSTGVPLTVYTDREAREIFGAYLWDLLGRIGFGPKKKAVIFQWRGIAEGRQKDRDFLRYGNKLVLSAKNVHFAGNKWMQTYYDMIVRFGPEFISGYVTVLFAMALFMRERGKPPLRGLKAVHAHSESMSIRQKRIIEGAFGARIFPTYGLIERVLYGGGCEYSDRYHIYPQMGLLEFLDLKGFQEMVGTGFSNYAMPFIRYRTMDIAVKGSCGCAECGRNHPVIEKIEGRMYEFLVTEEGQLCPAIVSVDSAGFRNVQQFQFYQDEPGIAYLRIIRSNTYTDADTAMIKEELNNGFNSSGKRIVFDIIFVDEIERTPSGKTLRTDQRLDLKAFLWYPMS